MSGTSSSARLSSGNPQARIYTRSFSFSFFLFPALLFACGIGRSGGYLIPVPVSPPDSFRSLSSGSRFTSGIRTAATTTTFTTTAAAATPTTTASPATTSFWIASSSAATRASEPPRVPHRPSPLPRVTGHRPHLRDLGGRVRRLFSADMSEVSGDAGAAGASAAAAAATTGNGGGEVRPGDGGKTGGELRSSLPAVTLDADAIQKFAEIEVRWGGDDESVKPTILIRGQESAVFHKDAARPTMELLREAGEHPTMTGGGRVKHSTQKRTIFVYGYSIEFGKADLPRVAELCQAAYPDYEVTWKSGGY